MMCIQAEMFNRRASNPKHKPNLILKTLKLQSGHKVADIGAGGGYFTFQFAKTVGEKGQVFAVDTNPAFLKYIEVNAKKRRLFNITTLLATSDYLTLSERSLDLIFMRNVYHHLSNRKKYLAQLGALLYPTGRIAIIEYRRAKGFSFRRIFKHYVPQETILTEMRTAGYRLVNDLDFLPEQSFTIFSLR